MQLAPALLPRHAQCWTLANGRTPSALKTILDAAPPHQGVISSWLFGHGTHDSLCQGEWHCDRKSAGVQQSRTHADNR